MDSTKELFRDNLRDSHWLGEVIDNNDPDNLGRCKIRVFGKFDLIPDEGLPWANAANNLMHGQFAVPNVGDIVSVRFDNGNLYMPLYWFQVKDEQAILDKVTASGNLRVVSFFYDPARMQFYWTGDEGLNLITAEGDGVVRVPGILNLNGSGSQSTNPAVLGNPNKAILDQIINSLNTIEAQLQSIDGAVTTLAGSTGAAAAAPIFSATPLVPGITALKAATVAAVAAVQAANALIDNTQTTLSDNININ